MDRRCLNCGDPIAGRADKKFCSDYCRSTYNYGIRNEYYCYVKKVNYILRKNMNVLKELNPNGKVKVKRVKMIEKGFNFNYLTNIYTNKNGITYYYVYDQCYLPVDTEYVTLFEKPDYIK